MPSQRVFGRRGAPAAQPPKEQPARRIASVPLPVEPRQTQVVPPPAQDHNPETDEPPRRFPIPWRQISLMASLCFGIASLALPDSVNDDVQWLLYALMAASLHTGLRRRPAAKSRPDLGT